MTDQDEAPEIPEGFRKERWTFMGEFVGDGKRKASFRDDKGTEWSVNWKPAQHGRLAVGYIYDVLASDTSVKPNYQWTGDKAEDADQIRMEARKREQVREFERMQEKARTKDPDLDALLEHVSEYAARFTKSTSRDALVTLLTRAVYRAQRKSS